MAESEHLMEGGAAATGARRSSTEPRRAKSKRACSLSPCACPSPGECAGRACCDHLRAARRSGRVSVACQTDSASALATAFDSQSSSTTHCPRHASVGYSSDDGSKPEGTLRLMIQNFRNMTDTVRGPGKIINGVPWKIMVMPRQHVVQKKGTQKCLGFFLQCCPDSYSDSWSCQASAELKLLSQKSDVRDFTRKTSHIYTAKENDWGYSCFMTWADILDENQGYIKDDRVILEVFVKAEPPKNILTHELFCKKIEDYQRLAEMQSSRGLIDKAIEVNQSALKFCKEKDDSCKALLEQQRQRLIETKLKQSIERIEKGKQPGVEGEEEMPGANLNAIRQALAGNLTALKQQRVGANGKPKKSLSPPADDELGDESKIEEVEQVMEDLVNRISDDDDEDGASCSSDGDDDDSGASDELCDSCLQERLENIILKEDVRTSESGCQTETGSTDEATPPAPFPVDVSMDELVGRRGSGDGLETTPPTARPPPPSPGGAARWTSEKEAQLLELITAESRDSLDQIRETLERLVDLAQEGNMSPELDQDLSQLRNEQMQKRRIAEPMDVVELPAVEGDGDSVDGAGMDTPPIARARRADTPPPPPPQMPQLERRAASLKSESGSTALVPSPRRGGTTPMSYSFEEASLIAHAKEIVETKAEELVNKYSQLIEQSEATRLAETVKKVEKRMKDIERQTMTCRKELADECERHYREEQKLIKQNKQQRSQLDSANDKLEKVNTQLKDRKAEIKKLEKKLRVESQTSAENGELVARIELLERDLSAAQKKQSDDSKRFNKETHSLQDAKKQLQNDLNAAASDIERLNSQLEDKSAALRKSDQRCDHERKQANSAMREAAERAKKAEMNLLEFKMEMGLKMLQRAHDDSQSNIRRVDEATARCLKTQRYDDAKPLQAFLAEWQRTRDRITDMMNSSKNDFCQQIDAVKSGKLLASLPVLEVPKPPPPPKLPHSADMSSLAAQPPQSPADAPTSARQQPAPIGVRPSVGAVGQAAAPSTSLLLNGPGGDSPMSAALGPPRGLRTPPGAERAPPVAALSNGFSPWSDPLNNLAESLLGANRQHHQQQQQQQQLVTAASSSPMAQHHLFGAPTTSAPPPNPAASWSDGWGAAPPPGAFAPQQLQHQQLQQHQTQTMPPPPPPQSQQAPPGGQWGVGWGYQQVTSAPSPPAAHAEAPRTNGLPPPPPQQQQAGRAVAPSPVRAPPPTADARQPLGVLQALGGGGDSRGSSPITMGAERHRRVDTLIEQLRATFPNLQVEALRDAVSEFRQQQAHKSLKGLSVEQALNGVVSLILHKQKMGNWKATSNGAAGSMAMDAFVGSAPSLGPNACAVCRDALSCAKVTTLKCKHRFHEKCVKDWLNSQQTCPSCGKFNPNPEDYPELA